MRQTEIFRHLDALETITNQYLIPLIANVAKAIVTLAILTTKGSIKLSYIVAIFATNRVVTNNREQNINHETPNPNETVESEATNNPVSILSTNPIWRVFQEVVNCAFEIATDFI